ncbi:MAG: Tryptophanyl-tRNA synthetase [uncultured Sphingomonadaceae bacterium]|uniref:Tryptophan--tRNA ligase n=1 Tax=uncultured Sphingomonadaceae bacterium TaxID=169976 RepID=A0A6J4THU4_9SPHN|nr:MAG: Tryptophanyl-tRNA synthetase [uncultured Sphingomonadaceae bacterium]
MSAQRIVSGIQPTGDLHLGNYLGAIRRWVRMQDALPPGGSAFYFLADLHAITVQNDPAKLRGAVREMAATLIAAGIDPTRSTLFNQARIPAHAELGWLLNCTARMGWLNRMTQFKEKSGKDREGASVGLFAYPVLQAADVLLYQATHVPVGEDQKQHLELARDIAAKFNNDFGEEVFTLPEPLVSEEAPRVMSLRDGSAKMSKSDPSDMSRVNLTDDPDAIAQKFRKARTDAPPLPDDPALLEDRPEARNLVRLYAALEDGSASDVLARFAGQGFGVFKPALAELTIETLRPIRARLQTLLADPGEIDRQLRDGAERAAAAAEPTLNRAYQVLGLHRR